MKIEWMLCPVCGNRIRLKIREDTELKNFPLFCPKCRQESLINVQHPYLYGRKKWNGQPKSNWALVRNQLCMDDRLRERILKYEQLV